MDMKQNQLLAEIMAVDFSAYDLHLYLNTHPRDQKALMMFNNCVQRSKALTQMYERTYGPLTSHASNRYPWQWIESPWPWE